MRPACTPPRVDAFLGGRVHSAGFMNHLKSIAAAIIVAASAFAVPAWSDTAQDQAERARLLRDLLEQDLAIPEATGRPNLPGARLDAGAGDARALRNREALDRQRAADLEWRRRLGEQQAERIRQQAAGAPSQAPARELRFEREQRMRDLSARILRHDQQYRSNGLN